MLDGAVVAPLQGLLWSLLFEVAALLWVLNRALLIVAYFLMALTGWISQQVFAPLLAVVGEQTGRLVGPVFVVAITVLALTYLLAVFGRFQVVSLRRAVLWLLFASALYTFGPNLYWGWKPPAASWPGAFTRRAWARWAAAGPSPDWTRSALRRGTPWPSRPISWVPFCPCPR